MNAMSYELSIMTSLGPLGVPYRGLCIASCNIQGRISSQGGRWLVAASQGIRWEEVIEVVGMMRSDRRNASHLASFGAS